MRQPPEEEIINRLQLDNPWRQGLRGESGYRFETLPKRDFLDAFTARIQKAGGRQGLVLMGPPRAGKTVFLHHAIYRLLKEGVDGRRILYLPLSNPVYSAAGPMRLARFFPEIDRDEEADGAEWSRYLFIDDVRNLGNWEAQLGVLAETHPGLRIIACDVAAFLSMQPGEAGSFHFRPFILPGLTFAEFLRLSGREKDLIGIDEEEGPKVLDLEGLNWSFFNYLNYGSFPEVVCATTATAQREGRRAPDPDLLDRVLGDVIPGLLEAREVPGLNRLLALLAYNSGQELAWDLLGAESGLSPEALALAMDHLEAALLVQRVRRMDRDGRTARPQTSFKAFLTMPSLRAALAGPVFPNSRGLEGLFQTALVAQLWRRGVNDQLFFARWREESRVHEVDLVGVDNYRRRPAWAVSVLADQAASPAPETLEGLARFSARNDTLNDFFVASLGEERDIEAEGVRIGMVPVALFCYSLGRMGI